MNNPYSACKRHLNRMYSRASNHVTKIDKPIVLMQTLFYMKLKLDKLMLSVPEDRLEDFTDSIQYKSLINLFRDKKIYELESILDPKTIEFYKPKKDFDMFVR